MVDPRSAPIGALMLDLAAACRQFEAADADISALDDLPGAIRRQRENADRIAALVPRVREHGVDLTRIARSVAVIYQD